MRPQATYIDYILLGCNDEELENLMTIRILERALKYLRERKPYEYNSHEIIQDRIDAREGARRAKLIN